MKQKVMKGLLAILMSALVLVSCTDGSVSDETGNVRFIVDKDSNARNLETIPQTLDPDNYIWTITAKKMDKTFKTGECIDKLVKDVPFDADLEKGLAPVGPFSLGDWKFTLQAYASQGIPTSAKEGQHKNVPQTLAFTGEAYATLDKNSNTVDINMDYADTDQKGHICFPRPLVVKNANGTEVEYEDDCYITFSLKKNGIEVPKGEIEFKRQSKITDPHGRKCSDIKVKPGTYELTLIIQDSKRDDFILATESIMVTVHSNEKTFIDGFLVEKGCQVDFKPKFAVETEVKTNEIVDETVPVEFTVPVAPDKGVENASTTLNVPANVLGKGTVTASVTSYPAKSVEKQDFIIEKGNVALGAVSIDLKQNGEYVKNFSEEDPITITTYIEKGLDPKDLHVKYNGVGAAPIFDAVDLGT